MTETAGISNEPEVVADPVSHISISGVHGRDELDERLANAPEYRAPRQDMLRILLLGAAVGAVIGYFAKR
jgi:hypothetical protein